MELIDGLFFLLLVALGAVVQTITGFAMALIIMGGVVALDLAGVAYAAAVVSLLTLSNVFTALRKIYRQVDGSAVRAICIGLIPAMICGVILLEVLSETSQELVRRILGFVIVMSSAMLLFRPNPWPRRSPDAVISLSGFVGGLTGGLFSVGGPAIAFVMYRQPMPVDVIRATLLCVFAISNLARTSTIAVMGQINLEILAISLASVPVSVLATMGAQRAIPYISDLQVRKFVFGLLSVVGVYLLFH